MKSLFPLGLIALLAASCGTGETKNPDLVRLTAERDSLKNIQRTVNARIKEIDDEIKAFSVEADLARVTAYRTEAGVFEHYFTVFGDVRTDYEAMVYPEMQGVIKSISVSEGQRVSKGTPLMSIDVSVLQQQTKELEANLKLATETFKKQESLWKQNIGSEIQFLQAKTQKESLESALNTLNTQISKGTVTAPFDGVVDAIFPKTGEMASPAMPVIRLVDMRKPYVKADVSEDYLGKIKQGTSVEVIFPGIDTLRTTISRVGNFVKPENRTFEVTIDLDGRAGILKPNLFATIRINDFRADSAVAVPSSLIRQDADGRSFVWLIEAMGSAHKTRKHPVSTGMTSAGKTHITSGLSGNELIVNKGAQRAADGESVIVLNQ
jgi:membrane fusion protein, multidrug efflux system